MKKSQLIGREKMSKMHFKSGFLMIETISILTVILLILTLLGHWMASFANLKYELALRTDAFINASNMLENAKINGLSVLQDKGIKTKIEQSDLPNFVWVTVKCPIGANNKYIKIKSGLSVEKNG